MPKKAKKPFKKKQDLPTVFVEHLLKTKKEYKNLKKQKIQNKSFKNIR